MTAASVVLSSPARTTRAQTDPAALQQQVVDAINRGDLPAILTFFTDDAVIQGFPDCSTPCVGVSGVQREFQAIVAANVHVTLSDTQASGTTVTSRFEATSDYLLSIQIERIVGSFVSEARGDKIASASFDIDPNDPQSARFLRLYAGTPGTQTPSPSQALLPDTGGGPTPAPDGNGGALALAAFGACAVLIGLVGAMRRA